MSVMGRSILYEGRRMITKHYWHSLDVLHTPLEIVPCIKFEARSPQA